MPHDRRTGRVLLAMMGLVGVATSAGCMRSWNLRSSAGTLPDLAPAGELRPASAGATPGTGTGPTPPSNAGASSTPTTMATPPRPTVEPGPAPIGPAPPSPPGGTATIGDSTPSGPSTAAPVPAGERPAPPDTLPTPLLDAEIRRAQAVNRQHIESIGAADAPAPLARPADPPATTAKPTSDAGPKDADTDPDLIAPLPLADSLRTAAETEIAPRSGANLIPPLIPIDPIADGSPPTRPEPAIRGLDLDSPPTAPQPLAAIADAREVDGRADEILPARPERTAPEEPRPDAPRTDEDRSPPTDPVSKADHEERPPLEIAALRLISQVTGFGSIRPVDANALRPGQRILVYCEMNGVEYQARGDQFASRLAAHLELRPASEESVVWEKSPGIAQELCPRPRRDYYVSYRVELPGNLAPGPYRLRLIQTDLIANRTASREITVTIAR